MRKSFQKLRSKTLKATPCREKALVFVFLNRRVHTHKLVTVGKLAIPAEAVGQGLHVAPSLQDIGAHILVASRPWRRWNNGELVPGADDGNFVYDQAEHGFKQVGEWSYVVHPLPELGQGEEGYGDATEGDDEHEEEGNEKGGEGLGRGKGGYALSEPQVKELVQDDEHPDLEGYQVTPREADAKVPAHPVQGSRKDAVRNLRDDGSRDKGKPAIDLGLGLARGVQIAGLEEAWLELLHERRSDDERHEDGKEARLHVDLRMAQHPEAEGAEEADEDVQEQDARHVVAAAPHGREGAMEHGADLSPEGHGVLGGVLDAGPRGGA